MASDNEDNIAHTEITTRLEDKTVEEERDRRVAELMGDDDLRDLLIQRLQDGGHVAKKTTNEAPPGRSLTASFLSSHSLLHSGDQRLRTP